MAKRKATDIGSPVPLEWKTSKHEYKKGGKTPTGCRITRLYLDKDNDPAHQRMLEIVCLDGGTRKVRLQDAHQVSVSKSSGKSKAVVHPPKPKPKPRPKPVSRSKTGRGRVRQPVAALY